MFLSLASRMSKMVLVLLIHGCLFHKIKVEQYYTIRVLDNRVKCDTRNIECDQGCQMGEFGMGIVGLGT